MNTLGKRLGLITHISILDRKVRALLIEYPSDTAVAAEDWLLDVANARGARVVQRDNPPNESSSSHSKDKFTNEELVVSICLTQRLDRPQLLRLAAQFITRGDVDFKHLVRLSKMERIEIVIGEMARQALKVDCNHPPMELTLYGRAALELGFPNPKPEYGRSLDVDIVLWIGQAEELDDTSNFWKALEQLNKEFDADGLFISHLFEESQVILSREWRKYLMCRKYRNNSIYVGTG